MRLLLTLIFLTTLNCKTNSKRIVHIRQLGWSFELPSDFIFADSAFNQEGQINNALWDTSSFDSRQRVELFWLRPNKKCYFNSIIYVDSSNLQEWTSDVIADSRYYIGLANQTPQLKLLDTLLSTENVGGINLQKEYIKIYNKETGDTTYSYKFSRKYNNYSINMNIRYDNIQVGDMLLTILRSSKFED